MAPKKQNTNMFAQAAARENSQREIEARVSGRGETAVRRGPVRKRGPNARNLTLRISQEDRDAVGRLAEERGCSISDLLHQWIRREVESAGEG